MVVNLTPDDLFEKALADQIWPASKRRVYCFVTGQPYGTVDEDYIIKMLRRYNYNKQELLKERIRLYMFFGSPCPEWTGLSSEQLRHNRKFDPVGFYVFILCKAIQVDNWYDNFDDILRIREEKTALYLHLAENEWMHDNLRSLADEMMLPLHQDCRLPISRLKKKSLLLFLNEEDRELILAEHRAYYAQFTKSAALRMKVAVPAPTIKRVTDTVFNLDKLSMSVQKARIDYVLSDMFQTLLAGYDTKALRHSVQRSLDRLEEEDIARRKERLSDHTVYDPKTFGFGRS